MTQEKYINLSTIGYKDNYIISNSGKVYNTDTQQEVRKYKNSVYIKKADSNSGEYVCIFTLYKKAFNKPLYIDSIEDIQGEQWKPIKDTNNKYYVSNYGRVKSYKRNKIRLLSSYKNGKGYYITTINGTKKSIHSLVACAFVLDGQPTGKEKKVIHHKDFNKANNHANNLQWLTYEEHNQLHSKINKERKQSAQKGGNNDQQ